MNLPQFLRSLGKEEIKPGGSYASKTAIAKLELRSNERVLVVGPNAASTAMYVALTSRVNASSLLSNQGERVDCDDTQLMRRLDDAVGTAEKIPFENGTFDAALVEATLADLEPARQAAALREVARVLKPQGRIALNELAWRQPPTPAISARLNEVWGAPVHPHVVRGWWDLLEAAGLKEVAPELAVITYFSRKGMENDEGENAVNVFHAAFENPKALKRFTQAHHEFEENRRYYGVIIATAIKARA